VVQQADHTVVVHAFHHLELAVVVAAVENHLLDRDGLTLYALLDRPPNDPECPVADHLMDPVALASALPSFANLFSFFFHPADAPG
jgi:hypothetical protein